MPKFNEKLLNEKETNEILERIGENINSNHSNIDYLGKSS